MISLNREYDYDFSTTDTDTTRLWVSDQQWLSILERVKRGNEPEEGVDRYLGGASAATGGREHSRHAVALRCVVRFAPPQNHGADHGTYLVNNRNISSGGLGFVHSTAMQAGTRCTVALQPLEGGGMILPARVAWCREIQREAEDPVMFEVGVQFDMPIDLEPFFPAA